MKTIAAVVLTLASAVAVADETAVPVNPEAAPVQKKFVLPTEEKVFQMVLAMDALQTIKISQNPNRWDEVNPVLGIHPSTAKVVLWFGANAYIHYKVTEYMVNHDAPKWLLKTYEYVSIGVEGHYVKINFQHGVW